MAKMKSKKSSRRTAGLWKALFLLVAIACIGFFLLVALVQNNAFGKLPDAADLAALRNEEATLILASNGAVIGKVFAEERTNVHWKDLPKHVVDALVSTEDQRFFEHSGVDAFSYVRVFLRTIIARDRSGGGGSTISQQLIKNLYGRERHGLLTVPVNKIKEALVAQRLELVYKKEDIITLYLNSVPFGENVFGIESAAERFFSKPAAKLKVEEGAVLIGMLKANTGYNPRLHPKASKGRRNQVLALMAANGKLTDAVRDSLQALPLGVRYAGAAKFDDYGYFNARVEQLARTALATLKKKDGSPYDIEKDGLRIHTTLDTALQQAALRAAAKQLSTMQPKLNRELGARGARKAWERAMGRKPDDAWKRNDRAMRDVFTWDDAPPDSITYRDSLWHYQCMLQAAFLFTEPATGKVRAYCGGNDFRALPYDQVQSRRPIASAIKPMLYAAALEHGLDPCTYLNNEQKAYPEYGGWSPRNFDKDTMGGQVALWFALAHSMNIPTVDLYFRTGADTIRNTFRALQLPLGGVENPALALGAEDLSLTEAARAYGAFARQGTVNDLQLVERITDAQGKVVFQAKPAAPKRALAAQTAATITAMLQRAIDSGTGASLRARFGIRGAVAGKTGTSQDYGDAWFIAYTPALVAATWVGARDPSVHFSSGLGTGAQLALPIIGGTLAEVERSPDLRRKYMAPFTQPIPEVDMDCQPWRPSGFFNRLFFRNAVKEGGNQGNTGPENGAQRENIFQRIFRKKR